MDQVFDSAILAQGDRRDGVGPGRQDLGPGPDDALVAHQLLHVCVGESGAIVEIEVAEGVPEGRALAENRRPAEAGLECLDEPPQGLFVVGAGVDVAALQSQIAAGTTLPVHAPDDAELALARGAALASAAAPRYEASTVGLAYAQDREGTTAGAAVYAAGADTEMSAGATQMAAAGYMAPLGYSAVPDDVDPGYPEVPVEFEDRPDDAEESDRKPFLLVGSALTSIFVVGVVALVISLLITLTSIEATFNRIWRVPTARLKFGGGHGGQNGLRDIIDPRRRT